MYKKILLAYDGSAAGQRALLQSREIGQWGHSEMVLVAVMPPPPTSVAAEVWAYSPEIEAAERQKVESVLEEGLAKLRETGLSASGEMVSGPAVEEIARAASRLGADLIVVGHQHRNSWAERWWRGSVSKSLIEHAPCSVLVVISP